MKNLLVVISMLLIWPLMAKAGEIRYEVRGAKITPFGEVIPSKEVFEYFYNQDLQDSDGFDMSGEPGLPDDPAVEIASPPNVVDEVINDAMKARIGAENRVQANVNAYPYTAVAKVTFCVAPGDCGWSCTGWRVGRRLVVLNGHCVWNKSTKQFHSGYRIDFGFHNGAYKQRAYPDGQWVSNWYQDGVSGVDWGVLRLPSNVPNYTGWFGFRNYSSSWNGAPFNNCGYGSNWTAHPFNSNFQGCHFGGTVTNIVYSGRTLFHNLDTGQGSSGSPVFGYWNAPTGGLPAGYYSVGVNYAGFGPRDDLRMNSCSPYAFGTCGNLATRNDVYGAWLLARRNEFP